MKLNVLVYRTMTTYMINGRDQAPEVHDGLSKGNTDRTRIASRKSQSPNQQLQGPHYTLPPNVQNPPTNLEYVAGQAGHATQQSGCEETQPLHCLGSVDQ